MHRKENLILVHSFPTNSILLRGLIEFLGDYFNVYFIDLPGFTRKNPLQKNKISLKFYSDYLTHRIKKLNLDNYIVAGISFGFLVVNEAKLDPKKCKAILAVEPYLNSKFLNISFLKRFLYTHLLDDIFTSKISKRIWESPHAEQVLGYLVGRSDKLKTVLTELDYRAFFQTAKILMKYDKKSKYKKDIPYVLWVNVNDGTIKAKDIVIEFQAKVKNLLVKFNQVEHYPKDVSKKYFRKKIKKADILESIEWINRSFKY
jgi:pimeloyl-ACP methyl ester carboxylesterase